MRLCSFTIRYSVRILFENNSAQSTMNAENGDYSIDAGGAIYNKGTTTFAGDTKFKSNRAGSGGAIYNDAGSISFNKNTNFESNSSAEKGPVKSLRILSETALTLSFTFSKKVFSS